MTTDVQALLHALQADEPDWAIAWLIEHADPELWAPRQFVIVDELCKGSPSLAATWRAIYRLWLFYRPINRRHFGLRQIAALGGVGRGHLAGKHGAIRTLHNLELITVMGLGTTSKDEDAPSDRWEYHIDPAHLEAMSVRLVRSRIAAGQLIATRRSPGAQHRDLFAALELAPDEAMLDVTSTSATAPSVIEFPSTAPHGAVTRQAAPFGATLCQDVAPNGAADRDPRSTRDAVAPSGTTYRNGTPPGAAPQGAAPPVVPAPCGAVAPGRVAPRESNSEASWNHPVPPAAGVAPFKTPDSLEAAPDAATRSPRVPQIGEQLAPEMTSSAPAGALGSIERSSHGWREGAAFHAAEHTPANTSLAEMINRALADQLPALVAHVGAVVAAQIAPTRPVDTAGNGAEMLPEPPDGEPPLPMPLQRIWEMVSGHPATADDAVHLKMLADRYQHATNGHSEYWLGRVMLFAHLCRTDDAEPVKLKVINGYMKRMAGLQEFSTDALEDRRRDTEKGGSTESSRSRRGHVERAAGPPVPPRTSAPALPADLASHWVITTWQAFAGRDAVMVLERAQQLVAVVSRQEVWEAVLTNWRSRYGAKANFTHFDGLLETYQREAAAKSSVAGTDEFDPNGPPPSASVIDSHPNLDGEARATWYRRFHAAGESKAARQGVIRRLLAEHPIEPKQSCSLEP